MKIMHEKGFTLVELLITMLVFAVLASMAAPGFSRMKSTQDLNKSARELTLLLNDARAKAAFERRSVEVVLNPVSNAADTNTQLNWRATGEAVLLSSSPNKIKFLPSGLVDSNTDLTFRVCNKLGGSISRQVTVSRMGTLQLIKEGDCT